MTEQERMIQELYERSGGDKGPLEKATNRALVWREDATFAVESVLCNGEPLIYVRSKIATSPTKRVTYVVANRVATVDEALDFLRRWFPPAAPAEPEPLPLSTDQALVEALAMAGYSPTPEAPPAMQVARMAADLAVARARPAAPRGKDKAREWPSVWPGATFTIRRGDVLVVRRNKTQASVMDCAGNKHLLPLDLTDAFTEWAFGEVERG